MNATCRSVQPSLSSSIESRNVDPLAVLRFPPPTTDKAVRYGKPGAGPLSLPSRLTHSRNPILSPLGNRSGASRQPCRASALSKDGLVHQAIRTELRRRANEPEIRDFAVRHMHASRLPITQKRHAQFRRTRLLPQTNTMLALQTFRSSI